MTAEPIADEQVESFYKKLNREAESGGYHLNPDREFTLELARSLLINQQRYGYPACPCRLASGEKEKDLDLICPCDYRDADLNEYGCCFCALYVSDEVLSGKKGVRPIPERRGAEGGNPSNQTGEKPMGSLSRPVWRCKVCGYLCARPEPPLVCPICKAGQERFERFL